MADSIQRNLDAIAAGRRAVEIRRHSVQDGKGNMVRGFVTAIRCGCGILRWDDGTPCRSCGKYSNTRFVEEEETVA